MNIALLAHDGKKELMVQFCIAYCGILASHHICAPGTTAHLVSEATGLHVTQYFGGDQGGIQQISARIAYNEIDLVLYFCDASGNTDCGGVNEIARMCDNHNIPFASNVATAEVLIQGLKRGDLDWCDIVKDSRRR